MKKCLQLSIKLPETPLTPEQVALQEAQASKEGFLKRDLIAIDQMGNVLFLKGLPDETISAHSARAAEQGHLWGKVMVHFLDFFQKNHGVKAEAGDLERAQAVAGVEDQALGVNKQT